MSRQIYHQVERSFYKDAFQRQKLTYGAQLLSRFQNAVNNRGKLTLTTPYLDAFGSGLLVDIVHSLYEGKSSGRHDTTNEVVAVIDASFDMFRFYRYSAKNVNLACNQ